MSLPAGARRAVFVTCAFLSVAAAELAILQVAPLIVRSVGCSADGGCDTVDTADVDDAHRVAERWGIDLPEGARQAASWNSDHGFQGDGDRVVILIVPSSPDQGPFSGSVERRAPDGPQQAIIGRIRDHAGAPLTDGDLAPLHCAATLHLNQAREQTGGAEQDDLRSLVICTEPGSDRFFLFEEII